MSAAEAEQDENHWPGFVDALSTIVMVVTFLLIILAIAIFALSLNVAKVAATTPTPIETTNMEVAMEIPVEPNPVELESSSPAQVLFRSDRAVVLRFEGTTLAIDPSAQELFNSHMDGRSDELADAQLILTAYFAADEAGYAKNQRIGYYRAMAVRNLLLGKGYAPDQLQVFVREAPAETRIDTVEVTRGG